jgi:hypothetical protein
MWFRMSIHIARIDYGDFILQGIVREQSAGEDSCRVVTLFGVGSSIPSAEALALAILASFWSVLVGT